MLQALVDGLLLGGVYGVIATGLSLVFGVLGVVNFAHAEFLMLGMYVAWFAWRYLGLDPLIGSVLSFIVVFAVGYGVQRTLIQRVLKAPPAAQVFLTVGLLIVIENAALMVFGSDFRSVSVPYQVEGYRLGDIFIGAPYLYAFIAAVILAAALWLFLDRSWMGRAIRAVAQDPMAATLVGVDTGRTYGLAFGLGVALTAFGGAVILPYITVSPTIGGQFVVLMFTVVVLGGLGSVAGALAGGIMVGIVQSMSTLIFPIQLQNLCLFVIFIAVLALRPQGLIKGA
ncbi:branched-chain amino acid ABC transporter permease [Xanthobacter autotrophicus]|uniref:Branched-chain amino acid ABC transporter permease n=1 Tax=Xanthobacter autotrophicus TaxID=280 RepID=A0A6C1KI87_XANAU|nr:branched-chain amino acid ABC transporter permease [Xanthobacter autotrophicus]TLX42834.1 branched-chain amino acid ABC transporter permease [Xanthobacter autotrophicus]